jgi:hypothetical protein
MMVGANVNTRSVAYDDVVTSFMHRKVAVSSIGTGKGTDIDVRKQIEQQANQV